jgi:hypothetical protein
MFITLLAVTFGIAVLVTAIVARVFHGSIAGILRGIFPTEVVTAWQRYMAYAIYVVGISGGVRIWELERYITPHGKDQPELILNAERWVLEVYRTIISALQSTAWLVFAFFLVAIIAYGIVRLAGRRAMVAEAQP